MRIFSFTLIIVGLLSFESAALAQARQSPGIARPCTGDQAPSLPILKRRPPTPDDPTAPPEVDANTVKEEPCDPQSKEADPSHQRQVRPRFEGLSSLAESDVLLLLRNQGVSFPKGPAFEANLIKNAEQVIREALVARGFRHATVHARVDKVDEESATVTFVVSEGKRFGIAEIRFEGNRVFPSELLATKMREYLARFEGHESYDAEIFEYCVRRLSNYPRSQGYLQARFYDPKIEENENGLIVTLQADEGALYRFGKIEIEGTNFISPQQVLAMLDLQRGDIANGERISKWLFEELKEVYGENGFIQYTAEVTPEFNLAPDGSEGVVDFKVDIDEGPRFRLWRVSFRGENPPEKQLRQLVLLREGDVYNQKLFERSIDRLNETGLFQVIDKERDADFATNEEEGLVAIVIKLTKRED